MRKRPWRCINCGDRFAKDQTGGGIHWTVHDPRPHEQEQEPISG